ncbi:tRNA-dihydrouridine synthase family protein [Desulfovibrio sp. OttesenSCG-928-A18]|nr:tRNA-dihydrouridine synthase family protein [Desulfovibrio sp. OttesenSCG-928-A18]
MTNSIFPEHRPVLPLGPDFPWLAPLAGFSDLPFRLVCRDMGAALACTEMVSAKGLIYGLGGLEACRARHERPHGGQTGQGPPVLARADNGTEELLRTTAGDHPLVVQLFGSDPAFIGLATSILKERGYDFFDLNMGCSVPKVTKTGAGAALLREPQKALAAARALFAAAGPGAAGCKLRLGWDSSAPVYLNLAKALEDQGAAWITLHPRYARQAFSGTVDLGALEALAKAVRIPVLASGDLFRAEDALDRLERGAAGVMFGRGAMANPAIFRRYLLLRRGESCPDALPAPDLLRLVRRHAALQREYSPAGQGRSGLAPGLLKMRTVVPRYLRHLPGVKQLRLALTRCASWEELDAILNEFFREH